MAIRGLRGATTVDADTEEQIAQRTAELLQRLLEANGLVPADFVSIVFTATPDIHAAFPAVTARALGFGEVPLIHAQELDVQGMLPLAIRLLAHVETDRPLTHVYLHGATVLRPDLAS